MIMTLDQISEIRTVMVFRDKAPIEVNDGNARVISIRDIVAEWPPNFDELSQVQVTELQISQRLRPSDIVMPARGIAYPARLMPNVTWPVFPTGQIHVIKADVKFILPEFLTWYLNSLNAQRKISFAISGAVIQSLNKSSLSKIEVSVPKFETQEKIIALSDLINRQQKIRKEIDKLTALEVEITCSRLLEDSQ